MVRASENNFYYQMKKETLLDRLFDLSDIVERMLICFQHGKYDMGNEGFDELEGLFDYLEEKADTLYTKHLLLQRNFNTFDFSPDYGALKSRLDMIRKTVDRITF